jgi:hypothetical protein
VRGVVMATRPHEARALMDEILPKYDFSAVLMSGYMENPLRQNFFRAGHAHAGVLVILSLVSQILADGAVLRDPLLWFVRIGVPLSAILISSGFFFSVLPPTATQANGAIALIYAGAVILALAVITLGVGLRRAPQPS